MAKTMNEPGRLTRTYADGEWHDGSPPVLAPDSQAMWLSSIVFDGARSIGRHIPDLDLHCRRVNRSAEILGLNPTLEAAEIEALARDGMKAFPPDIDLYICPMYYAEDGFITPVAESTKFVLSIYEAPLPEPAGFSACLSSFRRPDRDQAPTEAKASCLYPNVARAVQEARDKGFDTAVVLDPFGNVAEFAYTNLFFTRDGQIVTPAPNGTFLNGITRQRVIQLLAADGTEVEERTVDYGELAEADELFSTGNYSKIMPCIRLDTRDLQPGPVYERVRALYMEFAEGC
ncbi:MAG: branched-chain amino acid aminotransferase [Alphaproteobacteria bacterium]|jgi:branched-chain amino acid aminotransferase|nr:branched-chain amino acid aminotransferase [Rhodospirillales bacterium]MDP6642682.1 branched-chain amino acid aminotransferase [Rhodospirillales bacterium]MDP6819143.1 branched-chain amino acid aminotransferase [Alphaproteobacteria bacterium]